MGLQGSLSQATVIAALRNLGACRHKLPNLEFVLNMHDVPLAPRVISRAPEGSPNWETLLHSKPTPPLPVFSWSLTGERACWPDGAC